MVVGGLGGLAALAGADDEADLEQVRFDHVFEGVAFLVHGGGEGVDARGAANWYDGVAADWERAPQTRWSGMLRLAG